MWERRDGWKRRGWGVVVVAVCGGGVLWFEKSKFFWSRESLVARLELSGIDGRAPPGAESAAWCDSTQETSPSRDIAKIDRVTALLRFHESWCIVVLRRWSQKKMRKGYKEREGKDRDEDENENEDGDKDEETGIKNERGRDRREERESQSLLIAGHRHFSFLTLLIAS